MDKKLYQAYVNILKEELLPAMGCTEPVAVAYAAALAKNALGALPDRVEVAVSANILKNVKSVIVPNTGGMKGVGAAAAAGIVAGKPERKLEALKDITEQDKTAIRAFLDQTPIKVSQLNSGCVFDIQITLYAGGHSSFVRIEGRHTNVVKLEKDGVTAFSGELIAEDTAADRELLNIKSIVEFADALNVDDVKDFVGRQIDYNSAIAEEGLKNDYGARVGKVLLKAFGNGVHNRAKATAAAGSDVRMNGCALPVVIVSGSGNQGMCASLPVIVYAKELNKTREETIRAVALSDLVTIHLKTGIGRLSAYCGAVSAGAGAGAGVTYLMGGKFDEIAHTIVNALAIDSGIICDGAKASCAAKIASAVDAGLTGMEMYRNGSQFYGGDGILEHGIEETIRNVGELARVGMKETDEEIIRLMLKSC